MHSQISRINEVINQGECDCSPITKQTMRKITQQAVHEFLCGRPFKSGNTSVNVLNIDADDRQLKSVIMRLHGNIIASLDMIDGRAIALQITNAGWFSNTTKERLNALPGVSIQQKNWKWYLNGEEWDGNMVKVNF